MKKIKSLYDCCILHECATLERCQRLEVVIIRRKHNREFLSNLILRDIQGRKKYIIIILQWIAGGCIGWIALHFNFLTPISRSI